MNSTQFLESLTELRQQVEQTSELSPEVRKELDLLDSQIEQMVNSNDLQFEQTLTDQLLALEVEFSSEHPTLERIVRDVIEKLSMMGI
ncbi:MAG: DUF4404 family protein [Gammaproteobacteria bacterium]|nr:DUF4404 family protein [Gammaproteobacteria bacterium]